MRDLAEIKEGDRVRRLLSETVPMDLFVVGIDEQLIHCSIHPDAADPGWIWTFDRTYGVEEDPDLGWGVQSGISGSRLIGILEEGDEPA
jgi:hypothetical protein